MLGWTAKRVVMGEPWMESEKVTAQVKVWCRYFVGLCPCQSFEVSVLHLSAGEAVVFPLHLCLAAKFSVSCMCAYRRGNSIADYIRCIQIDNTSTV